MLVFLQCVFFICCFGRPRRRSVFFYRRRILEAALVIKDPKNDFEQVDKMDLKQLQYFVASVDSGSFKKAAEVLYTSQPHISKTIKSLETELQVELLERKARGVETTEAGRRVYDYACRILVESGKIQNILEEQNVVTLCVAASSNDWLASMFSQFYTAELEKDFHAQYMESDMEGILQALHRHRAELGFVHVNENQTTGFRQTLEYKHLEFIELKKKEPLLFLGPKSSLYHAAFVTNKELRELNYVQTKDDPDFLSINLIQGNEDYQYHKRRGQIMVTNSRHLMIRMLRDTELCSIGCGICPEIIGVEEIRGIPIKGNKACITFGYVKRKRDELSPEARKFVDYVKEHL